MECCTMAGAWARRGLEQVGGPQQASKSLQRSLKGYQRVRRCIEGFEDISRDVRDFKEVSKGCPMTITPPSRSRRLDAMGVPGWGQICRGETNSVKADADNDARGARV